ncbi:tetratricopeptide repeat protein [Thalassospira profundimaris]|uniref:tetratricopeptide repeat protein n=1 Tax=Thalassospira profundimaris TaxID=502049 RepID=UPI0002871ADC|nr:tetratricopeptide repeat protein [Thalassospira profundimaris]EKF08334.1 Tetratricopeptide domain protein [Thalassospira profundimaris WP0211]
MPEFIATATATSILGVVGKAAGTVAGIGPVKDWLHGCKKRALAGRATPHNHDLVKGVRTAHICALDHIARRYTKLLTTFPDHEIGSDDHAFANNLRAFIDARLTILRDQNIDHDVLGTDDINDVLEYLATATTHQSYADLNRKAQLDCEARALKEITHDAGRAPSVLFVRLFKGEEEGAGWYEAFSLFVTEELKTNERFRSIFFATELADIRGMLSELTRQKCTEFPDLSSFITDARHQLDRMEDKLDKLQNSVDDNNELAVQLVKQLNKNEELSRKLEAENVTQQKVMAIARITALDINNVNDIDQAFKQLERNANIAIEVEQQGRGRSNLGVFVEAVLARVREKYDANDFDAAAAEADHGFKEWERRETERKTEALQVGLKILEAGLKQDILRQNAISAARRIAHISELKHPNRKHDQLVALNGAYRKWFESGRDAGLNFDLEVAIEIAVLALERASGFEQIGHWNDNLGTAYSILGERESGTERLWQAVAAYRSALRERPQDRVPLDWATTQNNLGNTFLTLGQRESGTAQLEQAVAAYQCALKERLRHRVPLDWAATQSNLGNALSTLGTRESGTERLEQAVVAYKSALEEHRTPLDWAMTQNNLGNSLRILGERASGTERLEQAVVAYKSALKEIKQDRVPLFWAMAQNNLGTALSVLGTRENGTERLEQAVEAFQSALEEQLQDRVPLDWATTQNNLGNTLQALGERESGTERLEQAIAAFQSALEERRRDRVPLDWAITQNNLGNALAALGTRESGTERLEQAVAAYQSALEERRRDLVPLAWAMTQNNLGNALRTLGEREGGTERLEQAIAACQSALEEHLRDRGPIQWAMTLTNHAICTRMIAARKSDLTMAELAVAQTKEALETFQMAGIIPHVEKCTFELKKARALLDHLRG